MIYPVSSSNQPYKAGGIEIPLGGMKRANADATRSAIKIAGGSLDPETFVELMGARYKFEANAKVLKVMNENTGTLLNTLA
jgi:hypothetical protein